MTEQVSDSKTLSLEVQGKEKIKDTIGGRLWLGYEETKRVIGLTPTKKSGQKNQITHELEKFEDKLIQKRKHKQSN